ncbi:hypothetical protein BJY52DRAFT_1418523 [Lactarius psammicola]|nr:hypothetical protein BJY52DRAFT_1418523 [Lactarius psammicola]
MAWLAVAWRGVALTTLSKKRKKVAIALDVWLAYIWLITSSLFVAPCERGTGRPWEAEERVISRHHLIGQDSARQPRGEAVVFRWTYDWAASGIIEEARFGAHRRMRTRARPPRVVTVTSNVHPGKFAGHMLVSGPVCAKTPERSKELILLSEHFRLGVMVAKPLQETFNSGDKKNQNPLKRPATSPVIAARHSGNLQRNVAGSRRPILGTPEPGQCTYGLRRSAEFTSYLIPDEGRGWLAKSHISYGTPTAMVQWRLVLEQLGGPGGDERTLVWTGMREYVQMEAERVTVHPRTAEETELS